jgi:hypothetical protein
VIEIAHAPRPRRDAADDEIIRRLKLEAHPGLVRVVTSDHWLSDQATLLGAAVQGADMFRRMLEQS